MHRSLLIAIALTQAVQAEPGLEIVESREGRPEVAVPIQRAQARPLGDAQIVRMTARMPQLPSPPPLPSRASRPSAALGGKPPTDALPGAFPERQEPPQLPREPLKVVGRAPEGEVELAQRITVHFNRPVDSQAVPPARLTPDVPGEWRWVGDQTLVFEPVRRLPMATAYQVEVAGTRWSFSTPPPALTFSQPQGQGVDALPLLYLEFNQQVRGESVLAASRLDGVPLQLASAEELSAQPELKRRATQAGEGFWVALKPQQQLAKGHKYHFQILGSATSREGSRPNQRSMGFEFTTHSPLALVDHRQGREGWGAGGGWFKISFNNDLAGTVAPADLVTITPPLEDQRISLRKRHLYISGHSVRNQGYSVQVSPLLRDRFGQPLGAVPPLKFRGVGEAPDFDLDGESMQSLPDGKLRFTTLNHEKIQVRVRAVSKADWGSFRYRYDKPVPERSGVIWRSEVQVGGKLDKRCHHSLDLNPAFKQSDMLMVELQPDGQDANREPPEEVWVQRSRLGANVASDGDNLQVWVTELESGAPVAGARVLAGEHQAVTDPSGVANLKGNPTFLEIRSGKESLFVPASGLSWDDHFHFVREPDDLSPTLTAYVCDDRHLYRPGETARIKGWVRLRDPLAEQPLRLPGHKKISYTLENPERKVLTRGEASLSSVGGFDFQVKIPRPAETGGWLLKLRGDGPGQLVGRHEIEVQEFRRPEFEVQTEAEAGEVVLQNRATVRALAQYFGGGSLNNAEVTWKVASDSTSFQPSGWDQFSFQSWKPWWESNCWWQPARLESDDKTFSGRTDAAGRCQLALEFPRMDEPRPRLVKVEATVNDVNRQTISGRTQLLVHPADRYVGLKTAAPFARAREPLKYEVVVTDPRGKPVDGQMVELRLFHLEWADLESGPSFLQKLAGTRQVNSVQGPIAVEFPQNQGGLYRLEASLRDPGGRENRSDITSWAEGATPQPPVDRNEIQPLTLIPNRKKFQPGEEAEILVQSTFQKGSALATVTREGLSRHQLLPLPAGSGVLKVPLLEGDIPEARVTVQAVGCDERGNPVESEGTLDLEVSKQTRQLEVQVSVREARAQPGQANQVEVQVKDPRGRPVPGAEVALLGVDEAILSLSESTFENPLEFFYRRSWDQVSFHGMRKWVALQPALKEVPIPGPWVDSPQDYDAILTGGAGGIVQFVPKGVRSGHLEGGGEQQPVRLRSGPSPLAFYEPRLRTDGSGRIQFPFRLGDTLTRFRVVALAAAEDRFFGKGESSLQTQLPLSIRPSPPRFLIQGDHCQLPLVVHNQGSQEATVQLAIRSDLLDMEGPAGMELEVPPGASREVLFPVFAKGLGTAHIQALATDLEGREDATQFQIPIRQPDTVEHLASYGSLDQGARKHPLRIPPGALPDRGGLEFSARSTALQQLTDAKAYLRDYPYECSEQVASRILGEVAEHPSPKSPSLRLAIGRLQGLQNSDGGWDFWRRSERSVALLGVHATHALVRAKQCGAKVDAKVLTEALNYVRAVRDGQNLAEMGSAERQIVRCYAIYVLERGGQPQLVAARRLIENAGGVQQIPLEGLGWLLPSLTDKRQLDQVIAYLERHCEETASSAHFGVVNRDGKQLVLSSRRRADCLILEGLVRMRSEHRLIPKLVRGLLDARIQGCWSNTQENCFAILALGEYVDRLEAGVANFRVDLWLNEKHITEQTFTHRSEVAQEVKLPAQAIAPDSQLIVQKSGQGRLYYRLGLDYVPDPLRLKARSAGLSVDRDYEALDHKEDVTRTRDGVWHIKAGANVKVTLRVVAAGPRHHVAIRDPLPAGLEILNPELKTTSRGQADRQWWFEHENLRDDRAEVFARTLNGGIYSYSYYARATSPGRYQVAPARAEEMYHPETCGHSSGWQVNVEP